MIVVLFGTKTLSKDVFFMKKIFLLILSAVMLTMCLTACGNDESYNLPHYDISENKQEIASEAENPTEIDGSSDEWETPILKYISALETQDYDLYLEAFVPNVNGISTDIFLKPNQSRFKEQIDKMIYTYGEDYNISYNIIDEEKEKVTRIDLIDEANHLTVEFIVSGSKNEKHITKRIMIYKVKDEYTLSNQIILY